MSKGIFVTGISTGVGKTVISFILCKKLLDSNYKVAYYKPVQTGGIKEKKNLISPDCRFLQSIIGDNDNFNAKASYIFKKAASPHYAGRLENKIINKNKIIEDYSKLFKSNDFIIVEGAGGIYVPLFENEYFIFDLIKALSLKIILVGNAGLGSINSVSLNNFFIESKGMILRAVILLTKNIIPADIETENAEILKKITKNENIFLFPKAKNIDTEKNIAGDILGKINLFPDAEEIISWIYE